MPNILLAAWWPLPVAVAWVLTRDNEFAEQRGGATDVMRTLAVALAFNKVQPEPVPLLYQSADAAWSALLGCIVSGTVRVSAAEFQRDADMQGNAIEHSDMPRTLDAGVVGSLMLHNDQSFGDCLVPEDWRIARGSNWSNLRGYRDVRVSRDDLLGEFRRLPPPVSVASVETKAIVALATFLRDHTAATRKEAFEWCRDQNIELTGRGFQNRVWPDARAKAGLDKTALAGRKPKPGAAKS